MVPPARSPGPLDHRTARRRDGSPHRTRERLARDGAPALGRERAQTLAREDVVRAEDRWRVRRPYGGRARSLRRAARSGAPGGVPRRKPRSADRRGARAHPGRAGATRARRLRVLPQWHGEPVRGRGCAPVMAQGERDRAAHGEGLRRAPARARGMDYPDAACIRIVQDNLSTHTPGSLYETFPAAEAHRILERLEFHYTPKHASWLNMVEIEIGVLKGQCLDRRINNQEDLEGEIAAWERQRNASGARVKWMFTTEKPRAKMGRAYPKPTATLDQPANES